MKIISTALLSIIFLSSAALAADPIAGKWKVTTILTTAYQAINETYHPGDRRIEPWRFTVRRKSATLKTPAGTITGTKVGKAWAFESQYDTGWGVIVHMYIVARVRGGNSLSGTIETRYYDSRAWLGNPQLGIDAWSFRGKKR